LDHFVIVESEEARLLQMPSMPVLLPLSAADIAV
jgi:hypothetical protein